jgi:hypothetical protein
MSTSKLQELASVLINKYFSDYKVFENHRPVWMTSSKGKRLELDFFVEKLKFAVEIQGEQHYKYVSFFHKSHQEFQEKQNDDKDKKVLCKRNSVTLYEIDNQQELFDLLKKIKSSSTIEGRFDRKFLGIIQGNGNHKSKIYGMATYMYHHFFETGKFYEEKNLVFHSFYLENKKEVDEILNKKMKSEKSKRRVENGGL